MALPESFENQYKPSYIHSLPEILAGSLRPWSTVNNEKANWIYLILRRDGRKIALRRLLMSMKTTGLFTLFGIR